MNYDEAVKYIFGLRKFGQEPGVTRAGRALKLLGNPEESLRVIHVAGTNGKGSVCAYLSTALQELGYTVGLFTSPHLVRVNERIRINGKLITDEDFLHYFEQVEKVSGHMQEEGYDGLAFFDFVFVMAVLYFRDHNPDYVIMETGLGGRTDATAALMKKQLSIITSISLDHTEILGDTISKIAVEKAGIIVPDAPVVYWRTNDEVSRIMEKKAEECQTVCFAVDENSYEIHKMERKDIDFSLHNRYYENSMFTIRNTGLYQVMNASLALQALCILNPDGTWNLDKIAAAIRKTCWAGRMEEIEQNVYLDGAHNPDGIQRFLETAAWLKGQEPGKKMYLLFGAVCEKDYESMIEEICGQGCFDGYVITQIHNQRALSTGIMEQEFRKHTDKPVYVQNDNRKAYVLAKKLLGENDMLLCAGSLYLVGAIKEMIGE